MANDNEERLAVYLDFENVAIGARDLGATFTMAPLLDALAERGRIILRRAYADWNLFNEHRRGLVDANVELIEIPQRSDSVRKNAADIKMAVDAMELALGRDFISTFVIVSGDSDFTPLVSKLRELDRRVIGVGLKGSTSKMLPPACDEFIFYDRLEAVQTLIQANKRGKSAGKPKKKSDSSGSHKKTTAGRRDDLTELIRLTTRTLSGLQRSATGPVYGSNLKRAMLRKDPTFNEADYGFRAFRDFLEHLEKDGHVALRQGAAQGDPEVDHPSAEATGEDDAFKLLRETVIELMDRDGGDPPLSGLKDVMRKKHDNFSEKDYGYSGFLQFCKAAAAKKFVELEWDEDEQDWFLFVEGDEKAA